MKDKTGGKPKGGMATATRARAAEKAGPLTHQDIARRAFELSLRRGNEPGHEQEDWLQAETELREEKARTP